MGLEKAPRFPNSLHVVQSSAVMWASGCHSDLCIHPGVTVLASSPADEIVLSGLVSSFGRWNPPELYTTPFSDGKLTDVKVYTLMRVQCCLWSLIARGLSPGYGFVSGCSVPAPGDLIAAGWLVQLCHRPHTELAHSVSPQVPCSPHLLQWCLRDTHTSDQLQLNNRWNAGKRHTLGP